jgi:hypothetical protein
MLAVAVVLAVVAVAVAAGLARSWAVVVVGVAVVLGMAAWVVGRSEPDPQRWLRGAAGEEATATLLERLPRRRWVVRHDLNIPASRANVDHLVVGPTGVWVVDSKAYRARVSVRRGRVWAGSHPIDVGPVVWEAERVARLLHAEATPIVAVHGVGLRRRGKRCAGVRIIPAARLVRRLRRGPRLLDPTRVAALEARAEEVWPPD